MFGVFEPEHQIQAIVLSTCSREHGPCSREHILFSQQDYGYTESHRINTFKSAKRVGYKSHVSLQPKLVLSNILQPLHLFLIPLNLFFIMLDERPYSNSHRVPTVHRFEDNEIGPNPRSKLSPTPIRSLRRKPNFCQQKPPFYRDEEPCVEDVEDLHIRYDRPTFEIRTRDRSGLEDDGSDFGYDNPVLGDVETVLGDDESDPGNDETVLGDDESELEDDKSDLEVILISDLKDDESDLEDFPMRNTASTNRSCPDYLELSLVMFDSFDSSNPRRWALLLEDPFLNVEDYYQLVDGPSGANIGGLYKFLYETGELGSFRKPDERHHITWIKRHDRSKVYCTARKAQHKFSHRWVLEIIWNLESQGIAPPDRGNELRKLEQEDKLYPKKRIDMVLQMEQEKARPFHQKLSDWARGRPDAILKPLLDWIDCRKVMLAIDHDPVHKYRNILQKQSDPIHGYYARVHHAGVRLAKRVDLFNWVDDHQEPFSLVYIYGRPTVLR